MRADAEVIQMKSILYAGWTGVFLFAVPPFAAAQADDSHSPAIVVTASRGAETLDDALVPVTVIDREQIERSGATSLPELLSTVPGVVVSRNGGVGQNTALYLRGTDPGHTLILVDGVKVGSATVGYASLQHLAMAQIEKVEIVRGARSSLYGSEALGGVIHVFTRRGGRPQSMLSAGIGTHATRQIDGGVSGGSESAWYSLHGTAFTTDGFDVHDGEEYDDDGYENTSISLRVGGQVNDTLELEASVLNTNGEVEYDSDRSPGDDSAKSLSRIGSVRGIYRMNDRWTTTLLLGRTLDRDKQYLDQVYDSVIETNRDQFTWQNDLSVGSVDLLLGVDHISEEVYRSEGNYEVDSRDNTGIFAAIDPGFHAVDMELSLRSDDNEQFGRKNTGGIAMGHDLGRNVRAMLSWSEAFKAPTFNDLYWPDQGNLDLEPETAQGLDVGLVGSGEHFRWSANLFIIEIENLIDWAPNGDGVWRPQNINEVEIEGMELAGSINLDAWKISGSLTLQDPRDSTSGQRLDRRSKRILNLRAERDFGPWSIGASLLNRGKSKDRVDLDAFTVVNLRAGLEWKPGWSLNLQLNNLFDEEYQTAANYHQDGFNMLATLEYRHH